MDGTNMLSGQVKEMTEKFLAEKQCSLSYYSKKFFMLYVACVYARNSRGYIAGEMENVAVNPVSVQLFHNEAEDWLVSCILSGLDFNVEMNVSAYDMKLVQATKSFISLVQSKMVTYIHTYDKLFEEVYNYIKKIILVNAMREEFYDIKLDETHIHIRRMYQILQSSVYYIENIYDMDFKPSQIAALALIFRKYVLRNRIAGRNVKKIVIVTNSSMEMTNFFYYFLKQYIDVELIGVVNINELYMLDSLRYDCIFTFSNRIKTLLAELGIECMRLNFYITHDEINQLTENGFSTAIRRIHPDAFINDIRGKSDVEIKAYLLTRYPDFFIH